MISDPKSVAGIQLSYTESSLSHYSVYHFCGDTTNRDLRFESNASKTVLVCASPVIDVGPISNNAEKDLEVKSIRWPDGDDIRHGTDVHINNLERLQLPDGNQYIHFSLLHCCCFVV